ncbi:MAG: hypothetical protein JO210_06430 [Acidobacteriaceae bacterium]|nr:hypothetical protein [Acidobacteriaceae bacterium]
MSPRQARRERREADRKARKAEIKRMKAGGFIPSPEPVASELDEEFSPEFIAHARAVRERIHAGLASHGPANHCPSHLDRPSTRAAANQSGFVSQPASELPSPINSSSRNRTEINRANAQHSTGPRSPIGKLASSRNSLRHGLASGTLIIPNEDPAAFEALQNALLEEHQPAEETERLLVIEMAQSWWLTQRAIRLQNECFTENGIDPARLALFLRYQTTHERAFHKALNTLISLQKDRRKSQSGFVSQSPEFVRQNPPSPSSEFGFVSQNTVKRPQARHPHAREVALIVSGNIEHQCFPGLGREPSARSTDCLL